MRHKTRAIATTIEVGLFSASWRIVLEGLIAGQSCPKLRSMELAHIAARTVRGVQLHREAWPISAHYLTYTRYARRVWHSDD